MSVDLSRLDDSSQRILAVASSIADQQLSRRITWRHILAGAMHQISALDAKLREVGISSESLLDDQKHVGDRELGGPRPEGNRLIPLSVEVASAIADSDGTAVSFIGNVVKASAEAIIRLTGSRQDFEHVLQIAGGLDSLQQREHTGEADIRVVSASPPIGKIVAIEPNGKPPASSSVQNATPLNQDRLACVLLGDGLGESVRSRYQFR